MPLACSTIGFAMVPLDNALQHIALSGYEYVEVGVLGSFCPHLDPRAPIEETVRVCEEMSEDHGIRIAALNSAPSLYHDEDTDAHDVAERLLAICRGLGCDLIIDVGERTADAIGGRSRAATRIRRTLRRGLEVYGVRVMVEAPHRETEAETVNEAAELLQALSDDVVPLVYDTSHAPFGGHDIAAGLRLLGDRIARVHARDYRGDDGCVTPGDGEYAWGALAAFLRRRPVPVCVELEFGGRLSPADVATEAVRARGFLEEVVL